MLRRLRQWGRVSGKALGAISAGAVALLMTLEGFSALPYKDIAGVWTNGFGNTRSVGPGTPAVSREQARTQLEAHVAEFIPAVQESLRIPPTQGQLDAYTLLTYNIGPSAFRSSSVVKAHNAGDFYGACLYMLRWDKATVNGQLTRSRGLSNRRYAEYNICLAGLPYAGYVPRRKP